MLHLEVNNPHKFFIILGNEDDDGENKIINLLPINKDPNGGWWGHYPYSTNPNIVNIEFLLNDAADDDVIEKENMAELIQYCKKYNIKYVEEGDDELMYIQIPIKYINMDDIDKEL